MRITFRGLKRWLIIQYSIVAFGYFLIGLGNFLCWL